MRFQSAVRLCGKVRSLLCEDILRCRNRKVLICCEVSVEFNVLRVKLRRSVREDCRKRREVIRDLHDEVSARGDNVVRGDVIADSRSEVAARCDSAICREIVPDVRNKILSRCKLVIRREVIAGGRGEVASCGNCLIRCEIVANGRDKILSRDDSAVRNEIPADLCRQCFAHVGRAAEHCILARCQLCAARGECTRKGDILARRQYGIRIGMDCAGCLEIPRLRRERNLALARNSIDRQIRLCHSVECATSSKILRRDAVRGCGECGLACALDVLSCDSLPLGSQVAARRHIMDLEICTRCDDRVADDAHVIRRDILCLGTQTTARRHIVCREVCTCVQHGVIARIDVMRGQCRAGVQRRRTSCRDILCGQLVICLNRQRTVRTHIAVKVCVMRFQSAVRLRIKVCPRLCKDVLRCRYRQVLICCEVGVEFDVLRVKRRSAVREHCRMRREVVCALHGKVAACGDNIVRGDVIADIRSEVTPCGNSLVRCEIVANGHDKILSRGDSAIRNEIPADIRRECSAHVSLIVQRCILSRRKAYVLLRRECSSQCDILARRQYGIRVGMNRTGCLEIPRLRRERNLALARNSIDRQIRLCHSVECATSSKILRRDAVRGCGECGLACALDVLSCDSLPLGIQFAADVHIMHLEICTRCDIRIVGYVHVIRRDVLCLGIQTAARRHIICREVCTCIQH